MFIVVDFFFFLWSCLGVGKQLALYFCTRLQVHDGKYVKDIVTSTTRILIPVYHKFHYSLLDVNMGTGVIRHHDSLGLNGHLSTRESAEWYQMAMNMVQVIREKNC